MLEWFKSKSRIKEDYYNRGLIRGQSMADKNWRIKLKNIKSQANRIIKEKNNKIMRLKQRVNDIERTLENFTHLFGNARGLALSIEEESEGRLRKATAHFGKMQGLANNILSIHREFEKKLPEATKKIDKFNMENLK